MYREKMYSLYVRRNLGRVLQLIVIANLAASNMNEQIIMYLRYKQQKLQSKQQVEQTIIQK